jgi:predicted nucleic acid-binding protein
MVRKVVPPSLYDTNILIDYLRGIEAARLELSSASDRAISILSWIEVMVGVPEEMDLPVRSFLATFLQLPVTPPVSERAVLIRKSSRMKLPDAIILATAQIHNRLLVTRNTRDFSGEAQGVRVP